MTMEADKSSEHDDTYENGDTLVFDLKGKEDSIVHESGPNSRRQKKGELKNEEVATTRSLQNTPNPNTKRPPIRPLPDRYITMRCPPANANSGRGMKQPLQLVFFRCTTVCLVLLCILLLGGLLGLIFYNGTLSETHKTMIRNVDKQLQKINNLRNLSRSMYHISNKEDYDCLTGQDLFILNHEVLEWQMKGKSFHLGRKSSENGKCRVPFSWKCTSSLAGNASTI
ncbi:uncharacterized protein LOC122881535 isoform X2 [Siniperca chuatsi]|uniref:uncharacterized protein LOC122881535 isoform X2 n=1 Tax=Siniperca chuatsi TaxID=119488 RepID=UPI001CE16F1D|nr:uncharacterized protein LOC122881535 isoform X2 [Siniperca chuatsi]